ALSLPPIDEDGDIIDDLVMWTARTDIFDVDPQAPQPTLEQIFAASWETS
ncbi:MAG: type VI secretion system-associated protein TagF, partial [Mesorhizobium sp.]